MRLSSGEGLPVAAIAAAAAAMIAPLWCVDIPAMPDFPAHLASFWLIAGGATQSPYYLVHWDAIPNLAFEFLVPILAPALGLSAAIRLLLSVAVAMWVVAPALVQRALVGKVSFLSLGAAFFAYNDNFVWGFFNYYFAAGLALLAFSVWIATSARRGHVRNAGFALAVLAIYFCHVFAAAVLLLLIGVFECARFFEDKRFDPKSVVERVVPLILIGLPALLAFLFLKPRGADSHVLFDLTNSLRDRVEAAVALNFDQPGYVAVSALAGFVLFGLWRGWLRIHAPMRFVLAVLTGLTILMPEEAMGGWGVDLRLPAILGALTFASVSTTLSIRWERALAAAAIIGIDFSVASMAGNWRYYEPRFREFRAAIAGLPRGVRMMTVLDGDAIGEASDQIYWHMAEFAVIDRDGFSPLLFTTVGQHVVRVRTDALARISARTAQEGSPPDVTELDDLAQGLADGDSDIVHVFPYLMHFQCHFDEVALIHLNGKRSPVPDLLTLRHAGTFFSLYDIDHGGCGT